MAEFLDNFEFAIHINLNCFIVGLNLLVAIIVVMGASNATRVEVGEEEVGGSDEDRYVFGEGVFAFSG